MGKIIDLTGQVFGRLSVTGRAVDYKNPCGTNAIQWDCLCSCGEVCIVRGQSLRYGKLLRVVVYNERWHL